MILLLVNTQWLSQLKNAVTVSRKEVKMFRSGQSTVIFFYYRHVCKNVEIAGCVFLTALFFQSRAVLRNLKMTLKLSFACDFIYLFFFFKFLLTMKETNYSLAVEKKRRY